MRILSPVGEVKLQDLNPRRFFLVVLSLMFCLSCSLVGGKMQSRPADKEVGQKPTPAKQSDESPTKAPPPKIISRQEWGARDAVGKMQSNVPQHITIHHTASPRKDALTLERKMRDLQAFSQSESRLDSGKNKAAWPDIPYHYYVAANGQMAEGRDVKFVGDTNTDYDPSGHVLIVLEGNFENEQPSAEQIESLVALVTWISAKFDIPVSEVKGHNDYASTACPGTNLKNMLPALRQRVAERRG